MIIKAIVHALVAAVAFVIELLPTTPAAPDLAGKVTSGMGGFGGYVGVIANWFPVNELGTALAGMLVFLAAITVFRLVAWCLALIHVGGIDA